MVQAFMYGLSILLLGISFFKDKEKTRRALGIAWNSFKNILPSTLTILMFVGITLALLDQQTIATLVGDQSGILGVLLSLGVGTITLLPSFVAFPLGGVLLNAGAGYPQVAALVSAAMAVGIITLPLEIQYFNKRIAWNRNLLTIVMCLIFSFVIGRVLG